MNICTAIVATLICSTPLAANAGTPSLFSGHDPMPDAALADIRGGQAWTMSRGNLQRLADSEKVQSFDWTAQNTRVQMDVWWGSIGSELIAEAVRSATPF